MDVFGKKNVNSRRFPKVDFFKPGYNIFFEKYTCYISHILTLTKIGRLWTCLE